jgi:hypothetical protein
MKYNPSLKYNLKKITEDQLPPDSWFKEYMQDVRNGEGWVHIDKVLLDISDTLNLDLYGKAGEVARTIRRLGYGKYLRESCKALREDNWTDYYDKIGELDFDEKTWKSRYKTRKELEAAIKKKYGWNVNKPEIKEAIDRWYNSSDDIDRFGESAVRKVKGHKITESKKIKRVSKTLKEAKLDYGNRYEFDTIGGKPEVTIIGNEVHMGCWSSGAKVFTSDEFQKKLDAAGERGEYYKAVQEVQDAINKELFKAMNRFDNDMKAVLKKYGFK